VINRESAINLAQQYFQEAARSLPHMSNAAVDEKNIVEASFAWILPWNDRRFFETGDVRFQIIGQHPLAVLRCDGTIMRLPALTKSEYIKYTSKGFRGTIGHRIMSLAEKLGYHNCIILKGNGDAY
jgi:hypothetical protein